MIDTTVITMPNTAAIMPASELTASVMLVGSKCTLAPDGRRGMRLSIAARNEMIDRVASPRTKPAQAAVSTTIGNSHCLLKLPGRRSCEPGTLLDPAPQRNDSAAAAA